ncbi:MAG TPA: methyltransferase domain-containing protein [bacterium]|nr:methyltransferase domain-containing protein [bacterium]
MTIEFWLRDCFQPPRKILRSAGVASNMKVLDFGCGPGGFSLAAAQLVQPKGMVYAVDIHPLALQSIEKAVARKKLQTLQPFPGHRLGELQKRSFDRVLFYDILHDVEQPQSVLRCAHDLLVPQGKVSVKDHRLDEDQIVHLMTQEGWFQLADRQKHTLQFTPRYPSGGPA